MWIKARETLKEHLPALSIGALGSLLLLTVNAVIPDALPGLLEAAKPQTYLPLLTLSLLLNLLCLFALIYEARQKPSEFTKHVGILWDDELLPHCPACETLLGGHAYYDGAPGLKCVKCDKVVFLWSDGTEVKHLTLEEARAEVKAKRGNK